MSQYDKNSRFPYLLALILVVLLINSIRSILDIHKSVARLDQAKFRLEELKVENSRLNEQIVYAQSEEYLQKAAIEELNMARPGETILIVEQLQPKSDKKDLSEEEVKTTKPTPLELWATEFKLQDRYFDWKNRNL